MGKCKSCGEQYSDRFEIARVVILLLILFSIGGMFLWARGYVQEMRESPCSYCERTGYQCWAEVQNCVSCPKELVEVETEYDLEEQKPIIPFLNISNLT